MPGCSNWTSLELRLPKCRDDPRRVVLAANRPEECQRLTTSQRDMSVKSHCRSRHNLQECRPGGECACRRRQKGRKCERRHMSHPQASILHWEAGLKPLYVRLFVTHWMADHKSESKRASDQCATDGEQRSRCKTFGALNEDLSKSSALCEPSWLNLLTALERSSQRSSQAWSSTGPWNSGDSRG